MRNIHSEISLNDGHRMPAYGYGVYKAEGEELKKALNYAISIGYRLIDTASFYKNEEIVGEVIKTCGVAREKLFITTKLWPTEFRDPLAALERSLKKLDIEYLDAYLLHWPGLDESLRLTTYEKLLQEREKGKIRVLGVSNFLQQHLAQIHDKFGHWPAIDQIEVHPRFQHRDLCDFCAKNGIQVVSWSPLGRGSGMDIPQIKAIAAETRHTAAQIVLRWQIQSGLVPLPKSVHEDRIKENADIFDFELTESQMKQIESLNLPGIEGRIGKDPMSWPPMDHDL